MKRLILAALVVALTATASDACFRGRALRQSSKSVTRTKTVQTAGVTPVRTVLAVPLTAIGKMREALPCPNCR